MQISSWQNTREYSKMLNHPSIQESREKYFLPVCLPVQFEGVYSSCRI